MLLAFSSNNGQEIIILRVSRQDGVQGFVRSTCHELRVLCHDEFYRQPSVQHMENIAASLIFMTGPILDHTRTY
jgi:hypothetical protein